MTHLICIVTLFYPLRSVTFHVFIQTRLKIRRNILTKAKITVFDAMIF